MKRLPAWLIGILVVLTALLMWIGIKERDAVGPVPTVLAVIWALFVLGSASKIFSRDDDH